MVADPTDRDDDRATQDFDREELEKLARESVDAIDNDLAVGSAPVESLRSRTPTLADPLTMAYLAQVARNSRTQDFDPADLPTSTPQKAEPELAHPNLKRR